MTTYAFSMIGATIDPVSGAVLFFAPSIPGVLVLNDSQTSFTYTRDPIGSIESDLDPYVATIDGTSIADMSSGFGAEETIIQISWNDGSVKNAFVYVFFDADVNETYLFQIGGDALPAFATQTDFEIWLDGQLLYQGLPLPGSGFEPGDTISLASLTTYGATVTEDDVFVGTAGDDVYSLGLGNDSVSGEGGNDTINGGVGNDRIEGGADEDELFGDGGGDDLYGQGGNDTVYGGNGADYIVGGSGDDSLFGGIGNDRINGGGNADEINGDDGNDNLYGNGGRDLINGGDDNDRLIGGGGHDTLIGGNGNDTISGGKGRDAISGGPGDDTLTGGSDKDQFVFLDGFGTNTITDWQDGVDRMVIGSSFEFADLTISDQSGDTLITFGTTSVLLEGIDFTTVTAADFDFDLL